MSAGAISQNPARPADLGRSVGLGSDDDTVALAQIAARDFSHQAIGYPKEHSTRFRRARRTDDPHLRSCRARIACQDGSRFLIPSSLFLR
jgi:hypothetical protein